MAFLGGARSIKVSRELRLQLNEAVLHVDLHGGGKGVQEDEAVHRGVGLRGRADALGETVSGIEKAGARAIAQGADAGEQEARLIGERAEIAELEGAPIAPGLARRVLGLVGDREVALQPGDVEVPVCRWRDFPGRWQPTSPCTLPASLGTTVPCRRRSGGQAGQRGDGVRIR